LHHYVVLPSQRQQQQQQRRATPGERLDAVMYGEVNDDGVDRKQLLKN